MSASHRTLDTTYIVSEVILHRVAAQPEQSTKKCILSSFMHPTLNIDSYAQILASCVSSVEIPKLPHRDREFWV